MANADTRYDFDLVQGKSLSLQTTVYQPDSSTVEDLTGCTARGKIRSTPTDATVAASFTCSIPTPTNGIVLAALSAATTAALTVTANTTARRVATKYAYDLELEFPDGSVIELGWGVISLYPEVTR